MLLLLLLSLAGACDSLQFFKNYHATGFVSLPYAEIKEPFECWYSASHNKSRIDVWDGMNSDVNDAANGKSFKVVPLTTETLYNEKTCFATEAETGGVVEIQGVLPDLSLFKLSGTEIVNGYTCDKYIYVSTPNNTHLTQTYTFYVYGEQLPVKLVMKGFNIISGSHVDEYVIDYTTFHNGDDIPEVTFSEPYEGLNCGDFPGPGEKKCGRVSLFADILAGTVDHAGDFAEFQQTHSRTYPHKEEASNRYAAFTNNRRFIASRNRQGLGYTLEENHMTDWHVEEHSRLRGKVYSGERNNGLPFQPTVNEREIPDSLDLRIQGAIGSVKDQAVCGSCWSFATTGSIEGAFFAKYGYRVSLSEQNLMDCSWGYGNNGCDGGEEWRAYEWIIKHGGISYEADYGPYLMADGYCHYNSTKRRVVINSYVNVTGEENLKMALFTNGATAVNIDASHRSLSFYQSGVYWEPQCKSGPESLDHAVLAVGWGTLGGKDYWIIKNSWSTNWGNVGYVLIDRKDNHCGVTTDATYVVVQ